MVKSVHRNLIAACFICVLMLMVEVSFAQKKNPTVYPYGGVPDSSRMELELAVLKFQLKFHKAIFVNAHFDSVAYLQSAYFDNVAYFNPN